MSLWSEKNGEKRRKGRGVRLYMRMKGRSTNAIARKNRPGRARNCTLRRSGALCSDWRPSTPHSKKSDESDRVELEGPELGKYGTRTRKRRRNGGAPSKTGS